MTGGLQRESEEEEERGTEEGWPLGGVAFPGNGLCPVLLGPDLSAEDLLPRAPEARAGQPLSELMTLKRARLPAQLGLQTSVLP